MHSYWLIRVALKHSRCILKLSNLNHPESVLSVGGTKVFVMPGGMMKSNANLVDLIEKVKPEIRTLIEKCNTVSCNSDQPLKRVACSGFCNL